MLYRKQLSEGLEEVCLLAREGLSLSPEAEEKHKLAFYAQHGVSDTHPYARLYAKCLSVMKSQLYAPEGEFTTVWSTPDRLPHRHMWLWDSIFHAVGFQHVDASLAQVLIRAVWVHQRPDSFIPHMADAGQTSDIIQPPVIAWGAWQVYAFTRDKAFLREAYEHNARFLAWCRVSRRLTARELYTWNTTSNVNSRCAESGMDNFPRFDVPGPLEAIDFSCYMANEVRHMALMARALGLELKPSATRAGSARSAMTSTLCSGRRRTASISISTCPAERCTGSGRRRPSCRCSRRYARPTGPGAWRSICRIRRPSPRRFPFPASPGRTPPLARTCGAGRYG